MLILSLTREQIANARAHHITFQNGALTMIVVDGLDYAVIMRIVTSALGATTMTKTEYNCRIAWASAAAAYAVGAPEGSLWTWCYEDIVHAYL